ncbi:hypothetical protein B9T31_01380 [Acinetobacter sp. ANC 4558]|uniref:transporter n=1 Tax=Acinetobacter sp. ANC 4558 TaxID=1977876 RepID=UPI000A34A357|nr:transporter [Acinetobacter sp. ANC 4558]OTG88199.1 hypothetical protein B9T31_01380 [Acinetobacter sp. ANC 4558]
MSVLKKIGFMVVAGLSSQVFAADFSFDRPGKSISTGITPVGSLAWEQALPSVSYTKTTQGSESTETTTVKADMMLRTGLMKNLELRLGWQGPGWSRSTTAGRTDKEHGLGDISVGLKQAIDLNDEKLSMAVLAEAQIATGNQYFTNHDDIYTLGSSVSYKYTPDLNTAITMLYQHEGNKLSVTAIPNIGYRLTDKWSGFSELVYRKAEGTGVEYSLGSGVIYAPNSRMQVDANIAIDLNGSADRYHAGFGVSYLF